MEGDNYFSMIPEWVLDAEVSGNAVRLYCVLQRYANSHGTCFPSRMTLARRMHLHVRTVDRCVDELESIGAIVVTRTKATDGDWANNTYLVITAMPAGVATNNALPSDKNCTTGGGKNSTTGSGKNSTLTKAIDNQSHTTRDAPTEVDAGTEVAKRWWDQQNPKPVGRNAWFALVNVCKGAIKAGWTSEQVTAALNQHGTVPSNQQMDRLLRGKGQPQSRRAQNDAKFAEMFEKAREQTRRDELMMKALRAGTEGETE